MPRRDRTAWAERRPIPCCAIGVVHAFGPGSIQAPNRLVEFTGSGDRRLRIPLTDLRLVCLYGPVRVTAGAVRLITDAGAALSYLAADGRRLNGTLQPNQSAWRSRRYRQYRANDDPRWVLGQARGWVTEKLDSFVTALIHYRKQGKASGRGRLASIPDEIKGVRSRVAAAGSLDSLRGFEGQASKLWFEALDALMPEAWSLPGRHRRPPTDPVNALLSFGYSWLFLRAEAACLAWGIDPAMGTLHDLRPGRSSLACDLVEPFRVEAVDRVVLEALACRRFQVDDFCHRDDNSVSLTPESLKTWIAALETAWHTAYPQRPNLQVRLIDRARQFVDSLPALPNDPLDPDPDLVAHSS